MEILEKNRNIIKNKFNSELIYSGKYLKSEKKQTQSEVSMFICISNID